MGRQKRRLPADQQSKFLSLEELKAKAAEQKASGKAEEAADETGVDGPVLNAIVDIVRQSEPSLRSLRAIYQPLLDLIAETQSRWYITPEEAAPQLGISPRTVKRRIAQGKIPGRIVTRKGRTRYEVYAPMGIPASLIHPRFFFHDLNELLDLFDRFPGFWQYGARRLLKHYRERGLCRRLGMPEHPEKPGEYPGRSSIYAWIRGDTQPSRYYKEKLFSLMRKTVIDGKTVLQLYGEELR